MATAVMTTLDNFAVHWMCFVDMLPVYLLDTKHSCPAQHKQVLTSAAAAVQAQAEAHARSQMIHNWLQPHIDSASLLKKLEGVVQGLLQPELSQRLRVDHLKLQLQEFQLSEESDTAHDPCDDVLLDW